MESALSRNWWLVVLRGVLAILFGLTAFVWPAVTLVVLVWIFGIYALVDGLVSVGTGLARTKDSSRWWAFLLEGVASIIAAVIALIWPGLATLAIVLLIASWAVITGVLEILAAIRLRHEIDNEWLLGLGGIISILLGAFLFFQPFAGGIAIVWTIAAYAVIFGALLIALGFRLRNRVGPSDRQVMRSA
jgi:uncharacterized membrane protein HdeD (DUF308 family)